MSNETENTTAASAPFPTDPANLQEIVEHIERLAASVTAQEMKRYHGQAVMMPTNIAVAADSLARPEVQPVLTEHFSKVDLPITFKNLRYGAIALDYLFRMARENRKERLAIAAAVERAQQLRSILNPLIETAVAQELIPSLGPPPVEKRKGRGFAAMGSRLIDNAMLLQEHASSLSGRLVIPAAYLDTAIETGTFLRESHAKRRMRTKKNHTALAERRDRVYTWLVGEYTLIRRIGAFVFHDQVDRFVPPLTSRKLQGRKAAAEAEEAAAPQPIPASLAPVVPIASAAPANANEPKPATSPTPATS